MNRELNVILTVMADGYDVKIEINGIDLAISGQKSESVKLFGRDNPNLPVLPPDMKQHICLNEGENALKVKFKRVSEKGSPDLTVQMQGREQFVNGATLFSKKEKLAVGEKGEFSSGFTL